MGLKCCLIQRVVTSKSRCSQSKGSVLSSRVTSIGMITEHMTTKAAERGDGIHSNKFILIQNCQTSIKAGLSYIVIVRNMCLTYKEPKVLKLEE